MTFRTKYITFSKTLFCSKFVCSFRQLLCSIILQSIALLDKNVPVVVVVPDIHGKAKTVNNMQECRARKSPVIAIATEGDSEIDQFCNDIIRVPRCADFIAPIPVGIVEQLFAYHVAKLRGCPIDQPRNLAKSVTVE